jgi:hypothetical protein
MTNEEAEVLEMKVWDIEALGAVPRHEVMWTLFGNCSAKGQDMDARSGPLDAPTRRYHGRGLDADCRKIALWSRLKVINSGALINHQVRLKRLKGRLVELLRWRRNSSGLTVAPLQVQQLWENTSQTAATLLDPHTD